MNKRLILSLLGILLFPVINNNLVFQSEANNISKNQEDLSPLITYTTEKIGDREKMRVTVTVEDRSGSGIKEFRDYNNNLISGTSKTIEFNKRVKAIFTAIDNNNNKSQISIDLSWINPLTHSTGTPDKIKNGSTYWSSSNIREWLNSSDSKVNYTSNPPDNTNTNNNAYDKEAGFLSEFAKEEIDAIAITEHRTHIIPEFDLLAKEGGAGNPGHANIYANVYMATYSRFATNYKNYAYRKELDKVYLMSPYEVYWYILRRGNSTEKELTLQAKSKNNTSISTSNWHLIGGTARGEYEKSYYATTKNLIAESTAINKLGIVPMINLKPDTSLPNNKKARELVIGEKIEFGRYLGADITWEVVNITDDGFPMLLSEKILDLKVFDAKGDYSKMYSDYIQYENYDVSILDDVQYKPTNSSSDINIPNVEILNEEELNNRQSDSFTLDFNITDDESGLKYVIKPDGTKTTNGQFSYTFTTNGNYILKTMDNAGNYNEFLVPVSNINKKPEISITSSSTSEWSKEDVFIDIDSSNSVKQYINGTFSNGSNISGTTFPNYISYAGKKFKISGEVKLVSYTESVLSKNTEFLVRFQYDTKGKNDYTYTVGRSWPTIARIPVNKIIEDGVVPFEIEYTIPSDYSNNLKPWVDLNLNGYYGQEIRVSPVNIKFEIEDDSDFAISSITLPDGTIINGGSYQDTISEDGIHNLTYSATDNRGDSASKTITIKIDKTAPTLDLNYNTNPTNQNIVVNITASDATSGVKRIKLPNGNYITNSNSTYTISGDGEYTFECEDVAGNITTKTITINNIDKEKPSVVIDKNNNWTNKPVQININTRD